MNAPKSYSFPRYLAAKKTIDDRALNKDVWAQFINAIFAFEKDRVIKIFEAGCGIGGMLERMIPELLRIAKKLGLGLELKFEYVGLDGATENIQTAHHKTISLLKSLGCSVSVDANSIHFNSEGAIGRIKFVTGDIFDYSAVEDYDALIAHAFLDLFEIKEILPLLFSLLKPCGFYYFPINFDGITIFQPEIEMDEQILRAYHQTMDDRITKGKPSGDSRAGRHLFNHLRDLGAEILAAGSSDWVVFPQQGRYPFDEAYFLYHMLHFFESSLRSIESLNPEVLTRWLTARRAQIERAELILIAHQMDFVGRVG